MCYPSGFLYAYRFIMFQMGLIFKVSDDTEKMQLGDKITFRSLDFTPNQLRNLRL